MPFVATGTGIMLGFNPAMHQLCSSRRSVSGLKHALPGDVEVINLPFKCIEGDYTPQWGDWHTRDMEDIVKTNPGIPM